MLDEDGIFSAKDRAMHNCVQGIINSIMKASLTQESMSAQLTHILEHVMSAPWISAAARGGIYLYDRTTAALRLIAHCNYTEEELDASAPISPECTGREAASLAVADGRNCVPIKSNDRLLGVISLNMCGSASQLDKAADLPRHCSMDMFLEIAANAIAAIALRNEINENLTHNYLIQDIINKILHLSLETISLQEHLQSTLDIISNVSWLSNKYTGSIFLIEGSPEMLVMKAHRGFPLNLHSVCSVVPLGKCLCGQCALAGQIIFKSTIDSDHEIIYEGMPDHGHYCIPIKSKGKVLGIINLYVRRGHQRTQEEDEFLITIANTLAGIVERKRTEDELKKHHDQLEEIVRERTDELGLAYQKAMDANIELKHSQQMLIHSEKMASLGQLVAGVAHEINTPIGIAVTSASHLELATKKIAAMFSDKQITKTDLDKYLFVAAEDADLIVKNLFRAADLIRSFKMVSADQTSWEKRRFNLSAYLNDIVVSLRPQLRRTPHVVTVECDEGLELNSYPGAFAQIITNLLINSILHAYDEGTKGTILIEAIPLDDEIILRYRDDGKGIPDADIKKIFDPFFTTKRGQGGSGLGLYITFNIITQTLKGRITCESEVGKKTVFTVTLPSAV
ncbi:MAG: GAF domain-containing sensor histidine kinase [Candidatus Magnetominusculus sp. LBB02]|nr:GAF domain-containing sensor histidine kinase [Candidatus Magnetominusculus sp. LBB02]